MWKSTHIIYGYKRLILNEHNLFSGDNTLMKTNLHILFSISAILMHRQVFFPNSHPTVTPELNYDLYVLLHTL